MSCIDDEIFAKFREISKRLIQMQKEVLSSTNLSLAEFKLLKVLDINEMANQTCLGDFCSLDKPTTSRLIAKLVNQNLVERKEDNLDRRKTYISLTSQGKKLIELLKEKMQNYYAKYFNKITKEDKSIFINLLNKTLNKEENLC